MNKRTILLICTLLPLLLLGCQSYTASKGIAAIEPLASITDGKTITKPSTLQEAKAKEEAEAREKEQQQQEVLASQLQKQLEQKLSTLSAGEVKLQATITDLENQLAEARKKSEQLTVTLTALTLEKETLAKESEQAQNEGNERIQALEQQNALLSYQIAELQNLIEEQEAQQLQQQAERKKLEQEQQEMQAQQDAENAHAWLDLSNQRDELQAENRLLKAQLEEKTLTIEEKVKLEQQRSAEAKRLESEKQAALKAKEAEQQHMAAEEEARRLAAEQEQMKIPPLDKITFPRLYTTDMNASLAKEGEKLLALMIPLSDLPWTNANTVKEVHQSISDLNAPVIFVTGHMENVIALVREMRSNAALFSSGAIITSFPILEVSDGGMEIQYQEKKTVRLALANLPEYQVVEQVLRGGDWKNTQKSLEKQRLAQVEKLLAEGSLTTPTLLGASLYEPSYRDWNTFSPVAYRQVDYLWPLSERLESEGFFDTYRLTHFNEATSAGNTLLTPQWQERVDFLFSRKILPLESTLLTIGGESAPDSKGYSRFGIVATYLIP
ncbi:hypothetical protein [Sphaerochaeta sp. PS]|uniref:hypothetical protein n=1 Tax=Sphaerochaeta sp. PS TaxID=3076336 RepID=UPI0028A419F4|nr:hypothetical protein [Sphaerochaeta sp. PS]MDT4761225.1 hypothetical protein [Sphaerochaeta sp. PS]